MKTGGKRIWRHFWESMAIRLWLSYGYVTNLKIHAYRKKSEGIIMR